MRLSAIIKAEKNGIRGAISFKACPFPSEEKVCSLPARYMDRKPRPAKAHDEWPLGKLFLPSTMIASSPVHSKSLVATPSGKQRQKKSGLGRPTTILILFVRRALNIHAREQARNPCKASDDFLLTKLTQRTTVMGTTNEDTQRVVDVT